MGRVSRVSPDSPYGLASLNLTHIRESDQGWYVCKVVFLNRSPGVVNGTWFHLDVHGEYHLMVVTIYIYNLYADTYLTFSLHSPIFVLCRDWISLHICTYFPYTEIVKLTSPQSLPQADPKTVPYAVCEM